MNNLSQTNNMHQIKQEYDYSNRLCNNHFYWLQITNKHDSKKHKHINSTYMEEK